MKRAVTLKDLAERLNTSVTTISKALNDHSDISENRKREIKRLAEEMNYIPNAMAKNLRSQKTNFVGLIIGDNSNPYFSRIVKGVEERLTTEGYHTLVFNSSENPAKEIEFINELRSLNVAGVIITPAAGNQESSKLLQKFGIPYVLVNRYINKNTDNYVIVDDEKAAYLASKHLTKYKHEKIFYLNFIDKVSTARERLRGYKKALKASGISPKQDWVINGCVNQTDGYKIMKNLLDKYELPFSVLCYSDYIALGTIRAINERDIKMPDEVAIMGIDDIDIASFIRPKLSTVHIPIGELGRKSADILMDIISEKDNPIMRQVILQPSIVIRDTA